METLKKLSFVQWSPETTLGELWQSWMRLNEIETAEDAKQIFTDHGFPWKKNITLWLQNTPTNDLLSKEMEPILKKTGIDIDAWMVCEAKKQLWIERPELRPHIHFDQNIHRNDVLDRLGEWVKIYGGNRYLALQMQMPPGSFSAWLNGHHKPSIDAMKKILVALNHGFISVPCLENAQFILMSRAILGGDPQEFFSEVTDFESALHEFLRPYPGHTAVKIGSLTGIHDNTISRLLEWKPVSGKSSCQLETIEGILRVLVERAYPELVDTFDEHRKVYRKKEEQGIWEVEVPLKELMNGMPVEKSMKESLVVPSEPVAAAIISDTAPATKKIMQPKETFEDVMISGLEDLVARLKSSRTQGTEPAYEPIGSVVGGVEHCLDPNSWRSRKGERVTEEEIEQVRKAIVHLRKVLCVLCELDVDFIRREVTPVLSGDLAELFVAHVGLEHLLGTKAAWEIVQGTRSMVRIASDVNGKHTNNRGK